MITELCYNDCKIIDSYFKDVIENLFTDKYPLQRRKELLGYLESHNKIKEMLNAKYPEFILNDEVLGFKIIAKLEHLFYP